MGNENDSNSHDFAHLTDLPHCPPAVALTTSGVFYAFHGASPPDASDFTTAEARNVQTDKDPCIRRSNSVFNDLESLRKLCHKLTRKGHGLTCKFISSGQIKSDSGVVQFREGHHHAFWVCAKTSMHEIFKELVS
jgi:hypothetical protein